MPKNNKDNEMTFESALQELENITEMLSKGDLPLQESVALFEKGMNLKKFCADKLNQAAKKIKILTEENGEYKEEDFEVEENE